MANFEYKRTCNRCEHEWYVPADIAEAKAQKHPRAVGWATPLFGAKRQAIRANTALIDAANAKLSDAARCGSCGSSSYAEDRVET